MILDLICIAILVFVTVGVYLRCCRAGRLMAKIPGPIRVPVFGHIIAMYKSPEKFFEHLRIWRKSYGRLWRLDGVNMRSVHIYHPEDVKLILSTTAFIEKHVPYNFLQGWLGEGLLVSTGDKWHQRRKMLTPAFHFKILHKYFDIFSEHTEVLLATIENKIDTERTNLVPFLTKTALLIMCETSLRTKVHETPTLDNYLQSIHKMGECVAKRMTKPWYIIAAIYMLSATARQEKSVLLDLHNFTKNIIQKRRENRKVNNAIDFQDNMEYDKKFPVLLDLLLDEEEKGKINDDGIREEIDTFLFEGHDTTATALTFILMSIANEPEIQRAVLTPKSTEDFYNTAEKLNTGAVIFMTAIIATTEHGIAALAMSRDDSICEELHGIYGDSQRLSTVEDLNKMKYLECCIKESLRLYPSVPFIARYLTEEVDIAGYRIPKHTMVDIHIFDIHRDPVVYPDPEKFRPERFMPQNAIERNPYSYIPFSAGPRNCIGQKFAIMELKTLMSGILRKYRLEPITRPEDLVFIIDLVLRTNHPIYVRFRPRENLVSKTSVPLYT